MEQLQQCYGLILYSTQVHLQGVVDYKLYLEGGARDWVMVAVDGQRVGVLWRGQAQDTIHFQMPRERNKSHLIASCIAPVCTRGWCG